VQITTRRGIHVTPQKFSEIFSTLQQVTKAHDPKQQAALVRRLMVRPRLLQMLPGTVQAKAELSCSQAAAAAAAKRSSRAKTAADQQASNSA
jgi:hypothetical protein